MVFHNKYGWLEKCLNNNKLFLPWNVTFKEKNKKHLFLLSLLLKIFNFGNFFELPIFCINPCHSETRAETAQTMACSENYMSVKKVTNRQDSWIMSRQLWERFEKVMRKLWERIEKVVRKLWESCEKFVRNLWEGCKKVVRKLWESCQKVVGQLWESCEKVVR